MSVGTQLQFPTWSIGQNTASLNTAFASLIPPSPGAGPAPLVYEANFANNQYTPNWQKGMSAAHTHLTKLNYTIGATTHDVYFCRPLNWSILSAAAAASQATISLVDDPGLYSTTYKYPTPGGIVAPAGTGGGTPPSQVANTAIATGHYVAYQYPDGTWFLDVVASGSYSALVLTSNFDVILPRGTVLFTFGIPGTTADPATGLQAQFTTPTVSTNRVDLMAENLCGAFQTLHKGDPLMIYAVNTGSAGFLNWCSGFFERQ